MAFLNSITSILQLGLPCVLLALGIFLTYRILDFADLTAEGSFLIGGCITIVSITKGIDPFVSTLFGMLGGVACGLITGVLNRFCKVPKLLSGIITMTACNSIVLLIMGIDKTATEYSDGVIFNSAVRLNYEDSIYSIFYNNVINNRWMNIIVMAVVVIVAMIAIYYFFGTEYGMAIRSTGINERMAKAQGINADIASISCVAIANGLIGLAGSLSAQYVRSITPNDALGYLVVGLASILIGEAVFGKRTFKNWIISVALGSIVYFALIQIAYAIGFPTQLNKLLYAILIVFALSLSTIKLYCKKAFNKIFKKKDIEGGQKNA